MNRTLRRLVRVAASRNLASDAQDTVLSGFRQQRGPVTLQVKVAKSLAAVPPDAWNACAFPGPRGEEDPHNPFLSHAFLSALEESGSVGGRTGWAPLHVLVEDEERAACSPPRRAT